MNTAIDDCSISNLRVVVLDELHMIDDDYRGYLLELMASKLLCLDHDIQIVGMSATLTVSFPNFHCFLGPGFWNKGQKISSFQIWIQFWVLQGCVFLRVKRRRI